MFVNCLILEIQLLCSAYVWNFWNSLLFWNLLLPFVFLRSCVNPLILDFVWNFCNSLLFWSLLLRFFFLRSCVNPLILDFLWNFWYSFPVWKSLTFYLFLWNVWVLLCYVLYYVFLISLCHSLFC